jgi:hypothetical protein
MKSIFDQYKLVNEGKLSESQFLRSAKMALPKIISNVTSFKDAVKILKNKSIISEAKSANPMEYGMANDWCDPQEYDLGMRYEIEKGTDEDKASKIVMKNLKDSKHYYSQLHLAGYDESAMKVDRKKRTDLPTEVKGDNFVDAVNGTKKVKLDKLTEDEMIVLVGSILTEVADQKKTIKESLLDNMKAKAKELADLYYNGEPADERNYLYNYIKNALKKGNLSDADQSELEAEWAKLNPPSKPSTTTPGPGSVELYRLGQRGNYTGD